MRMHLESHIKPLMEQFPALGSVLEKAGIGCTSCTLGTCRIQDILEIHDLDTAQIQTLLQEMGEVIYQGAPFQIPPITRKPAAPKATFCPPIQRMVVEHTFILRVIALLPRLIHALRQDFESALPLAIRTLEFVRTYADRYHHAKEEDILFRFFEQGSDILGVMLQDHQDGRAHISAVAAALAARQIEDVEAHLLAYGELLKSHIQREDTILYPWMDRTLTDREVGHLFSQCSAVERDFGTVPAMQERIVTDLELALPGVS
ncbi:MAG: hemerythrin domain-containing protein [Holophaga sp.]|nr:hemerythrin domain-containing protein [Holophaga sp.]